MKILDNLMKLFHKNEVNENQFLDQDDSLMTEYAGEALPSSNIQIPNYLNENEVDIASLVASPFLSRYQSCSSPKSEGAQPQRARFKTRSLPSNSPDMNENNETERNFSKIQRLYKLCSPTINEMANEINKYKSIFIRILNEERASEIWEENIKQNDILIIRVHEDRHVADDMENALKQVCPGICIKQSFIPPGNEKLEAWFKMLDNSHQIIVLVSSALEEDLVIKNYVIPNLFINRDSRIVPVYLNAEYKNNLPRIFQPLLDFMPMNELYDFNPLKWANTLNQINIASHLYSRRYFAELQKCVEILDQILGKNIH